MYTINEIRELIAMGFTPQQIAQMNKQEAAPVQKKGSGAKAPATAKKQVAKAPKEPKLYSTNVADYEPKAQDDNFSWTSYKAQRSHYCYAVVTNGQVLSSKEAYEKGVEVDYGKPWQDAKEAYEKVFKYIAKSKR